MVQKFLNRSSLVLMIFTSFFRQFFSKFQFSHQCKMKFYDILHSSFVILLLKFCHYRFFFGYICSDKLNWYVIIFMFNMVAYFFLIISLLNFFLTLNILIISLINSFIQFFSLIFFNIYIYLFSFAFYLTFDFF